MNSLLAVIAWILAALAVAADPASGADWPAFRGPTGDGVAPDGETAPLHWGVGAKNVRWKAPLPGPANSSPIVSRGRVFVTCAQEQGRKRTLYCFDRKTGAELWARTIDFDGDEPTHRTNPYCGSTPVADGTRVVVWHGSAGVFCYDFDGRQLWRRELGEARHDWGYGSSPILHGKNVILNFGPGERQFLVALDLETGNVLWKHDEPGGSGRTDVRMVGSWSTPVLTKVGGRDQVLCSMPTRLVACDPGSGKLLWSCAGLGTERVDMVTASPVVCGDVCVAFTGWIDGPTMGVQLGGGGGDSGDTDDVTATHRLWLARQAQRTGSGVAVDGHVYVVNSGPGTAQCIDCRSGKIMWTRRVEGGESWGSVVMVAGRFYVTSRAGVTTVFRADPEKFEILAANDLGEASHATPAVSDGEIFLRTDKHLYCIAGQ